MVARCASALKLSPGLTNCPSGVRGFLVPSVSAGAAQPIKTGT